MKHTTHLSIASCCALAAGFSMAAAQEPTRHETRSGVLEFEANGYPTDATVERVREEIDYQRAVQACILYDYDTRCMIENPQGKTEANWIQTNPKKGFFAYFRWYSPTKAFFDRSWKMGNIKEIE